MKKWLANENAAHISTLARYTLVASFTYQLNKCAQWNDVTIKAKCTPSCIWFSAVHSILKVLLVVYCTRLHWTNSYDTSLKFLCCCHLPPLSLQFYLLQQFSVLGILLYEHKQDKLHEKRWFLFPFSVMPHHEKVGFH